MGPVFLGPFQQFRSSSISKFAAAAGAQRALDRHCSSRDAPRPSSSPCPADPSYLAFLGRIFAGRSGLIAQSISPNDVAWRSRSQRKSTRPITIIFEKMIKPLLAKTACRIHRRDHGRARSPSFLSRAIALIVPIDWPEPFGLVMIEAMACGAPVYRVQSRRPVPGN